MASLKQHSLFGGTAPARAYHASTPAAGYIAPPGTGPAGETCGTCTHCRVRANRNGRHFYKCGLAVHAWTAGRGSDVLVKSPACARWQAGQPSPTTIRTFRHD